MSMADHLNTRLLSQPPSGIRRIGEAARRIPGCIALTIGEPDFDAPESVRAGIAQAILGGETHYPPNAGYPALRAQLADHLNARFGCHYAPEETVVTVGSTQALFSALLAILNPGDEVLVPVPCFGLYQTQIALAGGVYVPFPAEEMTPEGLARRITPRTRCILYASPNNPDGAVRPAQALGALADAALRHDLFLIADSVYDSLIYGEPLPTLMGRAEVRDRLIYVSGLSKSHAMTGVRVGYAAADAPIMAQIIKAHSALVVSAPGCVQRGCEGAFALSAEPMRAAYQMRRDAVYARLCAMGLDVALPGGAFYIYPSIARFGLADDVFCDRLMHEAGLALIPARCFGDSGHVRISYCYAQPTLDAGMDRLERFIRQLEAEQ